MRGRKRCRRRSHVAHIQALLRNVGRQTVALLAALDLYVYDCLDALQAAVLETAFLVAVTTRGHGRIPECRSAIMIPKWFENLTL